MSIALLLTPPPISPRFVGLARSGVVDGTAGAAAPSEPFPSIRPGSGLQDWKLPTGPALILVNPPFSYRKADPRCGWASGRVSLAASFMDKCLENAPKGSRILAILPDVLRTGTNYERWRTMIFRKIAHMLGNCRSQVDALTKCMSFSWSSDVGGPSRRRTFGWARPAPKTAGR